MNGTAIEEAELNEWRDVFSVATDMRGVAVISAVEVGLTDPSLVKGRDVGLDDGRKGAPGRENVRCRPGFWDCELGSGVFPLLSEYTDGDGI